MVTVNEADEQSVCRFCLLFVIHTLSNTVRTTLVILLLLLAQWMFPLKTEIYLQHYSHSCMDYSFFSKGKVGLDIYSQSAAGYTAVEMLSTFS